MTTYLNARLSRLNVLALMLLLALVVLLITLVRPAHAGTDPVPTGYIPVVADPCANEDGPGPCYWDAGQRGNGQGKSYVLKNGYQYFIDGTRRVH